MKSEVREIKKVKVWSFAKVLLIFGLILGLLYGVNLALAAQKTIAVYPDIATTSFTGLQQYAQTIASSTQQDVSQTYMSLILIWLGYWNILIMPILLAILYFLGGIIAALIYNLIARYVGGVKVVLN
ncbi:MAG: DUF3566 domain-containing protein [archaeon]